MLALVNDTGILVIVGAIILLFGASRIPQLARNLGEAGREFRKAHDEAEAPAPARIPAPAVEPSVTLTRAQLDALLADRAASVTQPRD